MATAAPRPCAQPGYRAVVPKGGCPTENSRSTARYRRSRHERGYGAEWEFRPKKLAHEWKKRQPATCEPGAGDANGRFMEATREPPPVGPDRSARWYGPTCGERKLSGNLAGKPVPLARDAGAAPQIRIAQIFGECSAPALRYGGAFGAGLLEDGELEERFDPAPAPRIALSFF